MIHPTAIIDPSARIAADAEIGPYTIIGPDVEIGPGTRVIAQVYIDGPTRIGANNTFYPFSTVGVASQDKKYKGERTETHIGANNSVREFVTIHRGTVQGGGVTRIGNGNLLMAYVHLAHDVQVADNTVLANGVTLGGHVTVGEYATIGAFTGVHQFCRVGRHAMIGGYSVITQDVMPFATTVSTRENKVFGANRVGLERRGFQPEAIEALQNALRLLTRGGLNTTQAVERIRQEIAMLPEVEELLAFIDSAERGLIK